MDVVVRLRRDGSDDKMLLFSLRRAGLAAQALDLPGQDLYLTGTVKDDALEAVAKALAGAEGALHGGDRHFALHRGQVLEHSDVAAAEAHLGGPYTDEAVLRGAYHHGKPLVDHIVQILYGQEETVPLSVLLSATGHPSDQVLAAIKDLRSRDIVRMFRPPAGGEQLYGLAQQERQRIQAKMGDKSI